MKSLGLYVSEPRSEQETDRPFAEPGVFVVNADGLLQVLDISQKEHAYAYPSNDRVHVRPAGRAHRADACESPR